MDELYKLGEDLRKERQEIAELFSKASDLSAEKVDEVRKREAALGEKQARFDTLLAADKLERDNKERLDAIGQVRRPVPAEGAAETKATPVRPLKAIADGWKAIGERVAGSKAPISVPLGDLTGAEVDAYMGNLLPAQYKTLFQLSSAPQEDVRLTRIAFDEQEERSLVNLPAPGTADMNTLSYLEETTFTNNAVETAEGSALGENAFAFTERNVTIRWIGAILPVTYQSLDDINWLRSYLDARMAFTVRQRLALQILVGNNTGQNLNGYETSVTQTQAKGADPVFDAVYKGIVTVRNTGMAEPDAIVFDPVDWQDVRLTRTADGIYILGNPAERGAETLFGLPVYQSTHQTDGTALVGAFREHSQLFIRQGVTLEATNAHSTFFAEGKIAIRATLRCALVNYRPSAFVKVTGI